MQDLALGFGYKNVQFTWRKRLRVQMYSSCLGGKGMILVQYLNQWLSLYQQKALENPLYLQNITKASNSMEKKKLNWYLSKLSMDKLNYILISAFFKPFYKITNLMCSKEQLKSSTTEWFNDLLHWEVIWFFFSRFHLNMQIYLMENRVIYQSAEKKSLAAYKESRSYIIPSILFWFWHLIIYHTVK